LRLIEKRFPAGEYCRFAALRAPASEEHGIVGDERTERGEVTGGHRACKRAFRLSHLAAEIVARLRADASLDSCDQGENRQE